jgi:hypothetical protein
VQALSDRATTGLVVVLACLAAVALMIGAVSLLTATLGDGSNGSEISVPYAIAWTAIALAVLGFSIAIPYYPHLRLQLIAITASWALALVALIVAGGMRSEPTGSAGGPDRNCTRSALEASSNVDLGGEDCGPRPPEGAGGGPAG